MIKLGETTPKANGQTKVYGQYNYYSYKYYTYDWSLCV